MIGFAAQRLMELETESLCGAGRGERSADRKYWRWVGSYSRERATLLLILRGDLNIEPLDHVGAVIERRP